MDFSEQLGYRLKMQRIKLGYTQKDLADILSPKVNISEQQISAIERGISGTSIENLTTISLALKQTPNYFCLGIDRRANEPNYVDQKISEQLLLCSYEDKKKISKIIGAFIEK